MKPNALTLVFLGRSGSGKGTQLKLLAKHYKRQLTIDTGTLFRALAKSEGPFGCRIKEVLNAGGLPPGWLASFLWLREIVRKLNEEEHLLLGGAPRRIEEVELLDAVMEFLGRRKPIAIYVIISEEEATQRLLKRGRKDDTPKAIKHRLQYFNESVVPVIEYYRDRGRLIEVNGEPPKEKVHSEIVKALKDLKI